MVVRGREPCSLEGSCPSWWSDKCDGSSLPPTRNGSCWYTASCGISSVWAATYCGRVHHRLLRTRAFLVWNDVTGAC